jgi:hypothetical protein
MRNKLRGRILWPAVESESAMSSLSLVQQFTTLRIDLNSHVLTYPWLLQEVIERKAFSHDCPMPTFRYRVPPILEVPELISHFICVEHPDFEPRTIR